MEKTLEVQVATIPLPLSRAAREAMSHADRYDLILFTSKNTVRFFVEELRRQHSDLPRSAKVAAVGPKTAAALRDAGLIVHFVPQHFTLQQMIKGMGTLSNKRILFPRAAIARKEAVRTLRLHGASVRTVPLYSTKAVVLKTAVKNALRSGSYAKLIFRSPSGVKGLLGQLNAAEKGIVRTIEAQCIGVTTARAARAMGFKKVSIADML